MVLEFKPSSKPRSRSSYVLDHAQHVGGSSHLGLVVLALSYILEEVSAALSVEALL